MRTDYDKLNGHEVSEEVEEDLEDGPTWGLEQAPGAGGEDEGIPCGDGECADEEVLVSTEVRREVQRRRELVGGGHSGGEGEPAVGSDF